MPVSFDQNFLHLTLKPYLSSESCSRKYEKPPSILKYYRTNGFVEKVWPANLALFIYVLTHYIETVK